MTTARDISVVIASCMTLAICSVASAAERTVGQRPGYGVETVASVGSHLLDRFDRLVLKGARVRYDVHVSLGMQGKIGIPAGSVLLIRQKNPLEACTGEDGFSDRILTTGGACLKDTNMDGLFDRAEGPMVFSSRNIKQPVPYELVDLSVEGLAGLPQEERKSFRQTLTYLGVAAGSLRVSYREYTNDMARPAFTEELTFPLEVTYPQTITWRDTKFVLLELTGEGLRYRVEFRR